MGEWIQLQAADGHAFPAYVARPASPARGAVVVLQEIFGVNSHIRAVADGYAAQGYLAVAPSTFHRVQADFNLGYSPEDMSAGIALKGQVGVWALAGDTDGVDGIEEIAGALLAPDTLARARELGIKATERLDDNDGHGFFGALGDAVITGPTLTNINDFRAILIQGA